MSTIIQIYVVTIWILVATSILLTISNMMLWSHLQRLKQNLSSDMMKVTLQVTDISKMMSRILRALQAEGHDAEVIPMRRPGDGNPRSPH